MLCALPDKAGCYAIINSSNGKQYIGSASNLRRRKREHWSALERGMHGNEKLQHAWNKHGRSAFSYAPLLICAPNDAADYEQRLIDGFAAVRDGYNIAPLVFTTLGTKHTEASRAAMSRGAQGRRMPPQSEEARLRKSIAHKGKFVPPMSEETKEKIAASLRGIKRAPFSEEHRRKLSLAKLGRKLTEQHRAAIQRALLERRNAA